MKKLFLSCFFILNACMLLKAQEKEAILKVLEERRQRISDGLSCHLVSQRIQMKLCKEKPERMLTGLVHSKWLRRHIHPVNRLDDLGFNLFL